MIKISIRLSLSYGLISGKVMSNYIGTNASRNERMTFLYNRRIIDKLVELDYQTKPSYDILTGQRAIDEQLSEFSKLKTIFKDLSVLGDMTLDTTEEDESKFEEQFDKVKNRSNVINQVY
ncbi:hypothetical protein ACTFIW_002814 [Dictyostelium discoideum]